MADTPSPPNLGAALNQAKSQTQPAKLPESIARDAPKKTFEMPGPLGAAMRQDRAAIIFAKDYQVSNAARAKNFADKQKSGPVISKANVREGTKDMLGPTFNDKSRGQER